MKEVGSGQIDTGIARATNEDTGDRESTEGAIVVTVTAGGFRWQPSRLGRSS
ncbi:hypothetical protein RGAI101_1040 [Roseobacter sp. GAI101]|nr:hypothetical protein RGAI101_1040 [Roseobacter sp. GAI101]